MHLPLWAILSKVVGNYCFQSCVFTAFQMPNILHTVLIKGYTRINEKVPCSHIINKYLIKGMGKPEAQILSFILISILLLYRLLCASSADMPEGRTNKSLSWWLALVLQKTSKGHFAVFQGLSTSCHQLWVLKRCCHFIQRDLLGRRKI